MTYNLYLPSVGDVCLHLAAARDAGAFPHGSLHLLVGDFHSYAKLGIFVDEVPDDPPLPERVAVLENSLHGLTDVVTLHSVLLAICRPGGPDVTQGDLDWRDAFATAAAAADTCNQGVYLVTDAQVGRLGGPTTAAA